MGRVWKQCLEKHQGALWGDAVMVRVRATSFQPTSSYHSGLEVVTQNRTLLLAMILATSYSSVLEVQ